MADFTTIFLIALFTGSIIALFVYLFIKTKEMASQGRLKMSKKSKKKDKSPGTIFEWFQILALKI